MHSEPPWVAGLLAQASRDPSFPAASSLLWGGGEPMLSPEPLPAGPREATLCHVSHSNFGSALGGSARPPRRPHLHPI